jgi:phage terminase large subunit GpA-like protein
MGSQMGKTDGCQLNVIGHRLDDDPAPVLYIGPTRSIVEKSIEPRIVAMFKSCSLWERTARGKGSTKTHKRVAGVTLRLAWAGSASELAADPAAIVLLDELDRMDMDVKGEGSPFEMAEARAFTYPDGRIIVTSTPKLGTVEEVTDEETGLAHWKVADPEDVQSPIWQLWQEGTRYEWAWPCPECGDYFIPRFSLLKWPENCTPQQALKKAALACPHCGSLIEDGRKAEMNARGVYVAPGQKVLPDGTVEGEIEASDTLSFWVSGLASPWRTFGQRARSYLDAERSGDPERIKSVVNTGFGELYNAKGEAKAWESVADLREQYRFDEMPEGVRLLTCGVDVQKDRLIYSIRGWGINYESWLIRHGELWGETEHDFVWTELDKVLSTPIDKRFIRLTLVDSGYRPGDPWRRPDNQIYTFCRRRAGNVVPSKGHDKQDRPYRSSRIDITVDGKVVKAGLQIWHIDTDYFKTWLHARYEWPPDQPGGFHLPIDATDDYCMQLTAEAKVAKPSGQTLWVRLRRANHYFDCEVLNVSAAHILQVHLLRPPEQKEEPKDDVKVSKAPRRNWTKQW